MLSLEELERFKSVANNPNHKCHRSTPHHSTRNVDDIRKSYIKECHCIDVDFIPSEYVYD